MSPISRSSLLRQTLWPSLRRALGSAFSVFTWPLFLIALISFAKLMAAAGALEITEALRVIVDHQTMAVDWLLAFLKLYFGLAVPAWLIDALLIYLFVGSAIEHAERDEILAVHLDDHERRRVLGDAIRERRPEYLFYRVPLFLRGWAVRLLWPLVAVYRLMTPFVVEGPGPSGDEISTSVPRGQLPEFVTMVSEAGDWSAQTLFDHRQVIAWQFVLGSGGAWLGNNLSGLF